MIEISNSIYNYANDYPCDMPDDLASLINKLYSSEGNISALVQEKQEPRMKCLRVSLSTIVEEYLGTTKFYYVKLHFTQAYESEQVKSFIDEAYPVQRCMHSYDCCGYTYCQGADVVGMQPYTYSSENLKASCEWIICVKYVQNV